MPINGERRECHLALSAAHPTRGEEITVLSKLGGAFGQVRFWIAVRVARMPLGPISRWGRRQMENAMYEISLVPVEEIGVAFDNALEWLDRHPHGRTDGHYLEFGVCTGRSMVAMHDALKRRDNTAMRLVGFDSFEGLADDAADQDDGTWVPGTFYSSMERTTAEMTSLGADWSRMSLVKGWFSDTCNDETNAEQGIERADVVMVDCDVYSAAVDALRYIEPLIADAAVIVFDDWNSNDLAAKGMGEAKAWGELLADHADLAVVDQISPYNENSHIVCVERTPVADQRELAMARRARAEQRVQEAAGLETPTSG